MCSRYCTRNVVYHILGNKRVMCFQVKILFCTQTCYARPRRVRPAGRTRSWFLGFYRTLTRNTWRVRRKTHGRPQPVAEWWSNIRKSRHVSLARPVHYLYLSFLFIETRVCRMTMSSYDTCECVSTGAVEFLREGLNILLENSTSTLFPRTRVEHLFCIVPKHKTWVLRGKKKN